MENLRDVVHVSTAQFPAASQPPVPAVASTGARPDGASMFPSVLGRVLAPNKAAIMCKPLLTSCPGTGSDRSCGAENPYADADTGRQGFSRLSPCCFWGA